MSKFDVGIVVEGGLGKHILFSACLSKLKEKHGKIVLVNAYPDVFISNPYIERNLAFGHSYLYEEYLKDIPVIKREPYLEDDYRLHKRHLIEVYCKIFNIDYSEDLRPQLFIRDQELNEAKHWRFNELKKKFILTHFTGGTTYYNQNQALNKFNVARDYPVDFAQKFIDLFVQKYPDIAVVPIRLQTEPMFNSCVALPPLGPRKLFPLVQMCETFVVIDSFIQHVSGALNKKGVVLFGGTDPKKLGYKHNTNLINEECGCECLHCHRPDSYFYDQTQGQLWECPHKIDCMRIKPERVLEEVSKLL